MPASVSRVTTTVDASRGAVTLTRRSSAKKEWTPWNEAHSQILGGRCVLAATRLRGYDLRGILRFQAGSALLPLSDECRGVGPHQNDEQISRFGAQYPGGSCDVGRPPWVKCAVCLPRGERIVHPQQTCRNRAETHLFSPPGSRLLQRPWSGTRKEAVGDNRFLGVSPPP